jgi:hypothetical protein
MKTPLRVLTTGHRSGNVVQRGGVVFELALLSPACLLALYAIVTSVLALAEQRASSSVISSSPMALHSPDTGARPLTPQQRQALAPYAWATPAPARPGAALPVLLADHAVQPVASLPCTGAAAACTTAGADAAPPPSALQAGIPSDL